MSSKVKILVTEELVVLGWVCNELVRRKRSYPYDLSEQINLTSIFKQKKFFSGSIMDKTSLRDAIKNVMA